MIDTEGLTKQFGRITLSARPGVELLDFEGESKTQIIKYVRSLRLYQCLTCADVYDKYKELRSHLIKEKHHFNLKELKGNIDRFKVRVSGVPRDEWTEGQEQTFQNLCVQCALLRRMKH